QRGVGTMAAKIDIFISYRRAVDGGYAGRLYAQLGETFAKDRLFLDRTGIPAGSVYPQELQNRLARCDGLLAVIGGNWLDVRDENGKRRRLDNKNDWVRLEIATALRDSKHVIPVLVQGASEPAEAELPGDMRALASRQVIRLTDD